MPLPKMTLAYSRPESLNSRTTSPRLVDSSIRSATSLRKHDLADRIERLRALHPSTVAAIEALVDSYLKD